MFFDHNNLLNTLYGSFYFQKKKKNSNHHNSLNNSKKKLIIKYDNGFTIKLLLLFIFKHHFTLMHRERENKRMPSL